MKAHFPFQILLWNFQESKVLFDFNRILDLEISLSAPQIITLPLQITVKQYFKSLSTITLTSDPREQ